MSLRRVVHAGRALALFASFGVIACGEVDGPAPSDDATKTSDGPKLDDLPRLHAEAICARYLTCSGVLSDTFGVVLRCAPEVQSAIEDRYFLATKRLVAEQKLSYDPAGAKICLDRVSAITCADLTMGTPAVCREAFGAKATLGSACVVDAECVGETFCDPRAQCPGVCAVKIPAGGPCTANGQCAGSSGCFGGKCGLPAAIGAACGGRNVCDGGAVCLATSATQGAENPVCKRIADLPVATDGEACDFTLGTFCGDGSTCFYTGGGETGTYRCGPKVGSGAPCLLAVPDACPADEYCPVDLDASPIVLEGVCTKRLDPGQFCGKPGSSHGGCRAEDICEPEGPGGKKVCMPIERVGGYCRISEGCFSGVCRDGVCVEGVACGVGDDLAGEPDPSDSWARERPAEWPRGRPRSHVLTALRANAMDPQLDALALSAALRSPRKTISASSSSSPQLGTEFQVVCFDLGIITVDDLRVRLHLLEAWLRKIDRDRAIAISLALKTWLVQIATGPSEPKATAKAEPKLNIWHERNTPEPHRGVPSQELLIGQWASENGVADLLDRTFASFQHLSYFRHPPSLPSPSLRQVFAPAGPAFEAPGCSTAELTRWRCEVQETLLEFANTRRAEAAARAAYLARALPTLSAAAQRLDDTLSALQRLLPPPPETYRPYPVGSVRFRDGAPPKVDISFGRGPGEIIQVAFAHLTEVPVDGRKPILALDSRAGAIVAHVRDHLRDPEDASAVALRAHLEVPVWQRTLARFEVLASMRQAESAARTDDRLCFRISHHFKGFPEVQVVVQTAKKGGGAEAFTAGRKSTAANARYTASTPLERRICDTLVELEMGHGYQTTAGRARLQIALITQLADHPRVLLVDGTERPAHVRTARLEVRIATGPTGHTMSFALAGKPVEARTVLDGAIDHETSVVTHQAEDTLTLVRFGAVGTDLLTALAEHPSAFPLEATDQLLGLVERLQDSLEVAVPPELEGEVVEADQRAHVRIAPLGSGDEGLSLRFGVRPLPGGPLLLPGEGAARVFGQGARGRVCARRDHAAERSACEAARESVLPPKREGIALDGEWTVRIDDPDAAVETLVALADQPGVIVEHSSDKPPSVLRASSKEVRLRVRKERDWFGLAGEVEIDETRLELAALLSAVRCGRRFVRVDKDKIVALADDLRARLRALDDAVSVDRQGNIVADALALPAVDALVDQPHALTAVKEWIALRERRRAAETFEPTLPKGLKATLRPYQVEGFAWLARLAAWCEGACLADDMGLGKTIQTLALLLHRKTTGPALVLAPTSVVANWLDEAARFAPSLRLRLYRGAGRAKLLDGLRAGDVVVCSYDVMVRDIVALERVAFGTLVLDEAQAIKNAQSRRAGAVRDLRAGFRLALSGTPIENHLGELWSLYHAIAPGLFGSWDRFRERFAQPIERDKDVERSRALAARVRPFLLRRTKEAVAPELPALTETVRAVTLSPGERERYETERLASIDLIRKADPITGRFAMLAAITRLRRLACNVRLVDAEARLPSSKLAAFLETVDEIRESGHRALVFSQFTTHLDLVREALDERGIRYQYLDGQTPAEERKARVDAFQRGEGELFLLSLKAGGTGLNLTGADYVIHLDPWWNPAVEDQATDRAHRIGQSKPVTVVRFVSVGTIEEGVIALHAEKRALADSLLEGGEMAAKLTSRQLLALVRAGEAGGPRAASGRPTAVTEPPRQPARSSVRARSSPAPAGAPSSLLARHP